MTTTLTPAERATAATDQRAVDRFLRAVESARFGTDIWDPGAVVDATVPMWRFTLRGEERIRGWWASNLSAPTRFEELRRLPTPEGEVVDYLHVWDDDGVPMAARHCHVLTVDPGTDRIVGDRFFCGGRWGAALMAEMADADRG